MNESRTIVKMSKNLRNDLHLGVRPTILLPILEVFVQLYIVNLDLLRLVDDPDPVNVHLRPVHEYTGLTGWNRTVDPEPPAQRQSTAR